MNWNKATDFEINKEVGRITGSALGSELLFHVVLTSEGKKYDPCNNILDAWPIIVSNSISLVKDPDDVWCVSTNACWVDNLEWEISGFWDKNPLRAAMIVFLMTKENKINGHEK